MGKKSTLLFIYGTLRKSGRANHLMQEADYVTMGYASGLIFHIDQYPGLILSNGNERVIGEVYRVEEALLKKLDQYEGCFESPPHYLREPVEVKLGSGEQIEAFTYVYQQRRESHELIECGDWVGWWGPVK